jgi:hypothetical protein
MPERGYSCCTDPITCIDKLKYDEKIEQKLFVISVYSSLFVIVLMFHQFTGRVLCHPFNQSINVSVVSGAVFERSLVY